MANIINKAISGPNSRTITEEESVPGISRIFYAEKGTSTGMGVVATPSTEKGFSTIVVNSFKIQGAPGTNRNHTTSLDGALVFGSVTNFRTRVIFIVN